LKEYGQQNAEMKKTNHELAKGVKLLRQNASASAKKCREYHDLLMEGQAENERLRALHETAHEEEYAKKYSEFPEKELAEWDREVLEKYACICARDIELGNKDIERARDKLRLCN
jgi:hypothetical protein